MSVRWLCGSWGWGLLCGCQTRGAGADDGDGFDWAAGGGCHCWGVEGGRDERLVVVTFVRDSEV